VSSLVPVPVSGLESGVTAISVGDYPHCALKDGGASCWGSNSSGELGNSSTYDRFAPGGSAVPVPVLGLQGGVSAISAGWDHTCALKGGAWCWGSNRNGELGNSAGTICTALNGPPFPCSPVPVAVPGLESGVTAISAGGFHTCAVKDSGVWCWGQNQYGQLGNNSTTDSHVPVAVSGLTTGVTAISVGENHICALREDGVWCWGHNVYGELGNNSTTGSLVPVAVSGLTTGVSAISAGGYHTCAVAGGGAWCWGYNYTGQLGNGTTSSPYAAGSTVPVPVSGLASGVGAISAGWDHTCAVADGGVWCWGSNGDGSLGNNSTIGSSVPVEVLFTPPTPSPVPAASLPALGGVDAISAGGLFTCALKDGGVWCWGRGGPAGTLGNNSTTDSHVPVAVSGVATGVTAISSGLEHICALKDGGAWCWGLNIWGELGNDSTTPYIPAPVAVSGLATGVTAISAGWHHTCALKDGGVWCWGDNEYGQLGNTDTVTSPVPVAVPGLESGVSAVSVGDYHTCALKGDGVVCWGDNEYGQLGNGGGTTCIPPDGVSRPCSAVPVAVSGLTTGVTAISAGTCALKEGGVWCWGQNQYGKLGNNSTTDSPVPVAVSGLASGVSAISAGWDHTCALTEGGAWCWGYNSSGQLGNDSTANSPVPVAVSGLTTSVSAISVGALHTCALKDGGAWCWGRNGSGELGNDSTTDSPVPVAVLAPVTPTPPPAPASILPNTGTGDIGAPAGSHLLEAALVMLATGLTLVTIGRRLAKNAG
jgi:alpha-tubulin suppressor-like RCC1 family protein